MQKSQYNLMLPKALIAEFEKLAAPLGPKRKWLVASAALMLLIEAPEAVRNAYIREASAADIPGSSFDDLLASLKAGRLRASAGTASEEASESSSMKIGPKPSAQPRRMAAQSTGPRRGPGPPKS